MNKLIEQMADDFCRWPLPESVPKTLYLKSTGESIFTHAEAIAMFTEIVGPKILALEAENERLRDAQLGNSAYLTADADRRAAEARLAVVERETIERCLLALRTKHAEIQHLWSEHGRDRDESYGIHTAISIVQALANETAAAQAEGRTQKDSKASFAVVIAILQRLYSTPPASIDYDDLQGWRYALAQAEYEFAEAQARSNESGMANPALSPESVSSAALANQPAGGQTQAYSIPAFLRQFPDQTAAAQALRNTTAETGNSQPPTPAPAVAHSKSQKDD